MRTVLHIGPSKTASKSIQEIIPLMGRPHVIKPKWAKILVRSDVFLRVKTAELPPGTIISEEALGDFSLLHPKIVAKRFFDFFGPCIIVYVAREPEERLASLFHQAQKNGAAEDQSGHLDLETYRQAHQELYDLMGIGHFAAMNIAELKQAFSQHDFRVVDFNLLKTDRTAFLRAFCEACEAPIPMVDVPHLNARRAT